MGRLVKNGLRVLQIRFMKFNPPMVSVPRMVKHMFKILQHLLKKFSCVFGHVVGISYYKIKDYHDNVMICSSLNT